MTRTHLHLSVLMPADKLCQQYRQERQNHACQLNSKLPKIKTSFFPSGISWYLKKIARSQNRHEIVMVYRGHHHTYQVWKILVEYGLFEKTPMLSVLPRKAIILNAQLTILFISGKICRDRKWIHYLTCMDANSVNSIICMILSMYLTNGQSLNSVIKTLQENISKKI